MLAYSNDYAPQNVLLLAVSGKSVNHLRILNLYFFNIQFIKLNAVHLYYCIIDIFVYFPAWSSYFLSVYSTMWN